MKVLVVPQCVTAAQWSRVHELLLDAGAEVVTATGVDDAPAGDGESVLLCNLHTAIDEARRSNIDVVAVAEPRDVVVVFATSLPAHRASVELDVGKLATAVTRAYCDGGSRAATVDVVSRATSLCHAHTAVFDADLRAFATEVACVAAVLFRAAPVPFVREKYLALSLSGLCVLVICSVADARVLCPTWPGALQPALRLGGSRHAVVHTRGGVHTVVETMTALALLVPLPE
jgi:predicted transcriptional regulator